jgi:hypothetical protein
MTICRTGRDIADSSRRPLADPLEEVDDEQDEDDHDEDADNRHGALSVDFEMTR